MCFDIVVRVDNQHDNLLILKPCEIGKLYVLLNAVYNKNVVLSNNYINLYCSVINMAFICRKYVQRFTLTLPYQETVGHKLNPHLYKGCDIYTGSRSEFTGSSDYNRNFSTSFCEFFFQTGYKFTEKNHYS